MVRAPRPETYDGEEGRPCMPDSLLFGKPAPPLVETLGDLGAIDGVRTWSETAVLIFVLLLGRDTGWKERALDALVAAVKLLDVPAVDGPKSIDERVDSVGPRSPLETRLGRL